MSISCEKCTSESVLVIFYHAVLNKIREEKNEVIIPKIMNSTKSNSICIVKLQVKYKAEQSFYEVSPSRLG